MDQFAAKRNVEKSCIFCFCPQMVSVMYAKPCKQAFFVPIPACAGLL
jgi:hypothetical protein